MNYYEAAEYIARQTTSCRVIRFYPDIHLGNGHKGLAHIASKSRIDVFNLPPGQFVVFANKAQTGLKIYAPGNLVSYLKSPDNKRLDFRVISFIPRYFRGAAFQYDSALAELLAKYQAA